MHSQGRPAPRRAGGFFRSANFVCSIASSAVWRRIGACLANTPRRRPCENEPLRRRVRGDHRRFVAPAMQL
jgi:hypothetical protein